MLLLTQYVAHLLMLPGHPFDGNVGPSIRMWQKAQPTMRSLIRAMGLTSSIRLLGFWVVGMDQEGSFQGMDGARPSPEPPAVEEKVAKIEDL
jgi:hypothetical protein